MTGSALLTVRGRVQGVGFRWAILRYAQQHGINGWAENEHDGSLHILAQAPSSDIDELITWVRTAPPDRARVDDVTIAPLPDEPPYDSFSIHYA